MPQTLPKGKPGPQRRISQSAPELQEEEVRQWRLR
jgi:hypothetical protein